MVLSYLDDGAQRLVFVLCLPLVDGVFATLLVTGAVETFSQAVNVALTVFTGAGALAVLYSESESREHAKKMVVQASVVLVAGALAISLIAPVFEQVFYIERLRYAAGLALLVIAGHLADIELADKFSVPAILLTGAVLSAKNVSAVGFSLEYVAPALATSVAAVSALYLASYLPRGLNLDYIRKAGALVLGLIAVSQFGVELPSGLGLAIFAGALAASFRSRN